MNRISKISKKKLGRIFLISCGFVAVGIVCSSTVSCSGVDSKITNNMVSKGDGSKFADNIDLKDEIVQALSDKGSSDAFKKQIANKVLYQWYYENANNTNLRDYHIYKDNWDKWTKDAKKSYDDKVNSYKSDHNNNWQYYFQNEVLDPIGASGQLINPTTNKKESAKDTYVRYQLYNNIRDDFNSKVFANDYLSLKKQSDSWNASYNLSSQIEKLSGKRDADALMAQPDRWQTLDYYPFSKSGYDPKFDLDWQFAYIQHVSFLEYSLMNNPFSISMVLWKGNDSVDKLKSVYNVYDEGLNPTGHVPTDSKVGYNFPIFNDTSRYSPFQNFVNDGFTGDAPTFFYDQAGSNTKLVNVPVNGSTSKYTDDSATLIKVNLSTDLYTTLDVTFSATAQALVTSQMNNKKVSEIEPNVPLYISSDGNFLPSNTSILKNFLFIDPANTDDNSVATLPSEFYSSAQVLGTTWDSVTNQKVEQDYLAEGGQLDQRITKDSDNHLHAEVFNHNSDYYKDGYTDLISAFQLSDANDVPLPYVMIRERSGGDDGTGGVHMIGVDGTGYLSQDKNTGYYSHGLSSDKWTQMRENDILKFRSYTSTIGDDRYTSNFNLTTDVKSYFTSNEDSIILQLANQMKDVKYYDGSSFTSNNNVDFHLDYTYAMNTVDDQTLNHNIFNLPQTLPIGSNLWKNLFAITTLIDKINICQNVIKNLGDSFDKLHAFNSSEEKNLKFNGVNAPDNSEQDNYPTYDVYKNGLASKFPFAATYYNGTNADYGTVIGNKVYYKSEVYNFSQITSYSLLSPMVAIHISNVYAYSSIDYLFGQIQNATYFFGDDYMNQIKIGKINSGMAKYSEHIFTASEEINDLLNSFGGSNSFSNSYINNAYVNYLNNGTLPMLNTSNYFETPNGSNLDNDAMNEVLGSNLYVPATISSPSDLVKLANGDSISSTSALTSTAIATWQTQKKNDLSWLKNYSADETTYLKTLANIKYLLTDENGNFNPKNFIDQQILKMKYGSKYVFSWKTQDSITYQDTNVGNNFGTVEPIINGSSSTYDLYKLKTNYQDLFENRMSGLISTHTSDDYANTTFVENSNYLKYATPTNVATGLVGYQGLTAGLSNAGTFEDSALTSNFINANPYKDATDGTKYLGALSQYNSLGYFIDVINNKYWNPSTGSFNNITTDVQNSEQFKESLTGYLYNNRDNQSVITTVVNDLNNSVPGLDGLASVIKDTIDPYTNSSSNYKPQRQTQALITSLVDSGFSAQDPIDGSAIASLHFKWNNTSSKLLDQFFNVITTPQELINPDHNGSQLSSTLFLDENGSTKCTRVLFEQLNKNAFYVNGNHPKLDSEYTTIWNSLITKYGKSLIYNLLFDASTDSDVTSRTTVAVRKLCNTNGKLVVYDRRYNDQLGYNWVKDYKDKN